MANEALIAKIRKLCEKRVAEYQVTLEFYEGVPGAGYEWTLAEYNSWNTHLAEMDEHHVSTNEGENHCWKDLGEYPCDFLITKAKRLLGVE
jgi:hypothetical protein